MSPNEYLEQENRKWPKRLMLVPVKQWPTSPPEALRSVWRSRDFLVQVYRENKTVRLSVCRTQLIGARWEDNITWDDLQRLKAECGYSDKCAIEIYPPDKDTVNVANMRHLWVTSAPEFMWKI